MKKVPEEKFEAAEAGNMPRRIVASGGQKGRSRCDDGPAAVRVHEERDGALDALLVPWRHIWYSRRFFAPAYWNTASSPCTTGGGAKSGWRVAGAPKAEIELGHAKMGLLEVPASRLPG